MADILAGPAHVRDSVFGYLLRAIAWVTLVVAPVLLLLLMQIQFLPFHSSFIAWTQRLALIADFVLLWWLWSKILSGRMPGRWLLPHGVWLTGGGVLTLGALLFSLTVATFPGEWQEIGLSNHSPFSNRLVLGGLNVYVGLNIIDPKSAEWRDFVFDARDRDLNSATFDLATLPKVAFGHANLQNASFIRAQLQGASFDGANLRGATFSGVQLQNASLVAAQLQGARLDAGELQGALLTFAQLQGASLDRAHLQGALLEDAHLEGASLIGAQLQAAVLDLAWLQGAVLNSAQLQGASLDAAKLSGASLGRAQLQGASLRRAELVATDLSAAFLWRVDVGALSKDDAAKLVALRLPLASDQWLPVWMKNGNEVEQWNNEGYQDLRKRIEAIPAGPLRDKALDRIRRVDCANPDSKLAACSPPVDDTSQQKPFEDARVDDATYAKSLAAVLKDLVCNGVDNGAFYFTGRFSLIHDSAIYVLRGLTYAIPAQFSRIGATGPEALPLIDFIKSKDCLVFTALSDADRAVLLQIQRVVGNTPGP